MRLAGALHPVPFRLLPAFFTACTFHFVMLRTSFLIQAKYRRQPRPVLSASFQSRPSQSRCRLRSNFACLAHLNRIIWHYVKYFWGQRSAHLAGWLGLAGGGLCGSWLLSSARPARWTGFVVASRVYCARSGSSWPFFGCNVVYLGGGLVWVSCGCILCPAAALT